MNLTARCPYCNSALAVPDALRGPSQINTHLGSSRSAGQATRWIARAVIVLLLGVIVIALGFAFVIRQWAIRDRKPSIVPTITRQKVAEIKEQPSGFAKIVLDFGSEGIGPGMFKDARAIAVDASGKIYVGEYTGGHIQVFDPEGKFITQWSVDPKMPLTGMAADRGGTVYIVQSGTISRHEGASGRFLGQLPYSGGWGFDDIGVSADGGLVTSWSKNRDDIVRFNSAGQVVRTIQAAISSVTDDSELNTHVAVDGLGNIYALGTFNNAVFKFGPDGKYQTRFGSDGDQPGQFRAPSALAVDGKGRVYVSDFKGIQVFDGNGRYLTVFRPGGIASGMVFNDKNELFVAARKHVLKLAINE